MFGKRHIHIHKSESSLLSTILIYLFGISIIVGIISVVWKYIVIGLIIGLVGYGLYKFLAYWFSR